MNERDAAKWLQRAGFFHHDEGRITYQTETGQQVRVKPGNEARWRADLNRRRDAALGAGFRFTIPTAEVMAARWTPEGRAAALNKKQQDEERRRQDLASVLGMCAVGTGPRW